jgi:hydroxymethylglutaryl-CoA lyase
MSNQVDSDPAGKQGTRMQVVVSEVGPRDGLQSIGRTMPTAAKHRWIAALAAAGLREIEVGSFVHPKLLPQMADAEDVVREAARLPDLTVLALVPNLKGAQRAFAAGAHKVTIPVSASQAHNLANVRMTCEQSVEAVAEICRFRDSLPAGQRPGIEVGIASAFGCTREGSVSEDWVIEMARRLAEAGADSVGLSDSVGFGNPVQVRRLFKRLLAELGAKAGGAHFHNTRGQGLANVVAALDVGVTTFDASQGGLGGCPYAPGATGNIVTEDMVYLLESMGVDTGIDLDALVAARAILREALPGESIYGNVPEAGVHKGFSYADAARPAPASAAGVAACAPAATAA